MDMFSRLNETNENTDGHILWVKIEYHYLNFNTRLSFFRISKNDYIIQKQQFAQKATFRSFVLSVDIYINFVELFRWHFAA